MCVLSGLAMGASAETRQERGARMEWWREARFGIFVHWGLFSASGGTWKGEVPPPVCCWLAYFMKIPADEYAAALMPKFTGEHYDADAIAQLAVDAGMKYIIPITKHHEGFALYDSAVTDYKITNTTAKRDWIKELADASHRRGLKLGFYYSQNLDWHHPGGGSGEWDPKHKGDPDKYVDEIVIPQLRELLTNYGDVSILWWDIPTGWGDIYGIMNKARAERMQKAVKELRPDIIMNNRLGGDYSVEVAGQTLLASATATKGWFDRRIDRIGLIEVKDGGPSQLTVSIVDKPGVAVFDLQQIALTLDEENAEREVGKKWKR